MAEEEKKVTFKEKIKKAFPWLAGIAGTVGAGVLGFKFGKFITKTNEDFANDNVINRYLLDAVNDLKRGENVAVCIIDENDNKTYATLHLEDSRPDWIDNAYEVTTESYFSNLVTSVSTKK